MNDRKPLSLGIIVDGNRRWARKNGLASAEGHIAGRKKFKEVVTWAIEAGVGTLIAYTFSSENWNRPKEEVDALMILLTKVLREELDELTRQNCRVRIVGNKAAFSDELQQLFENAEKVTKHNTGMTVALALSYGGRDEIVQAARKMLEQKIDPNALTTETFTDYLWTRDLPDPDLIVRTSGETRLSNFLPWQSVYSELFFISTLWPDFTKEEFLSILEQFASRSRRFGR